MYQYKETYYLQINSERSQCGTHLTQVTTIKLRYIYKYDNNIYTYIINHNPDIVRVNYRQINWYYTSLTSHWLKLNHMTRNNFNVLGKLTQTGNNPLRASKRKQLFQNSKINNKKKFKVKNFQKISIIFQKF